MLLFPLVPDSLKIDQLQTLSPLNIDIDWFGMPIRPSLDFYLAANSESIFFGGARNAKPAINPNLAAGSFHEGLWQWDVVELFWGNTNDNSYQEFNLSPNGSWWSAHFNNYRERNANFIVSSDINTKAEYSDEKWFSMMEIPIKSLLRGSTKIEHSIIHLSAILSSGTKKIYISSGQRRDGKPDFHLSSCFRSIRFSSFSAKSQQQEK
jgi:hypothetical protein